jgi:hypothetical protein
MNAKLGSDGRLTLSDWPFNQLDSPDFAWRTKNSVWGEMNIQKGQLCVKGMQGQQGQRLEVALGTFQLGCGGFSG